MTKNKEGIPCVFYFYLHSILIEATKDGTMSVEEAEWRMFQWRIPKKLKILILKEMEILGLLIREDKRNIKLLKTDFDIENLNKYYFDLGIIKEN